MADNAQFGNPKVPQFGDRISPGGGDSNDSGHCAQCEAMLADALDEVLSPADKVLFDAHLALCEPCSAMLADAKRGAAWLEMLRDPRPEPPAELLERILAQTTGVQANGAVKQVSAGVVSEPAVVFALVQAPRGNVLPFRTRLGAAVRGNFFGHAMLQPRLAMTAAMAFFSIALTLNLTGVHLTDLRAGDLRPSSLKRGFYSANARVVQYYEGLRVVYELESRVHDLETQSDPGTTSGSAPTSGASSGSAPAQSPKSSPAQQQPAPRQQPPSRQSPGPGSSRREGLQSSARLVALLAAPELEVDARERGALA
ncbi:MAG: hypothetical protein NVSMB62_00060 [Acidobacteriaceae bacterium]